MSDCVSWMLEVRIKEGEQETFKAVMAEMVAATLADEPGALIYEWFVSDDGTSCHIYERYADSAATMTHLGNVNDKFGARFFSIIEPTRFVVYGDPSDQARGALGGLGATVMAPLAGFAR